MRLPRRRSKTRPTARRSSSSTRSTRARRPVVHRRTRGASSERPGDRLRTGLTSRAVVLAVAFCVVLLTLAVPLQQYLAQRGQLAELAAQERAAKARVAALERAQAQWQDPAYIKQQARQRLHFVKPGETAYVIIDPTLKAAPSPAPTPQPQQSTPPAKGAWYGTLWSTVETAGREQPKGASSTRQPRPTPRPIGPSPGAH